MLRHGAEVSATNNAGATPLDCADEDAAILQLLLEHGAEAGSPHGAEVVDPGGAAVTLRLAVFVARAVTRLL